MIDVTTKTLDRITIRTDALDPITVIFDDFGEERGKMIVECFGSAWSCFWGAMGTCSTKEFFLDAHNDYVIGKMVGETRQTDFDAVSEKLGYVVTTDAEIAIAADDMREAMGEEWYMDLPQTETCEVTWLRNILNAIREALGEER